MTLPTIKPGQRALVCGRTGSGKSTLANWLLRRTRYHWVIINPKWTAAYSELPDVVEVEYTGLGSVARVDAALEKHRFVNIKPHSDYADHEEMDALIMYLHNRYTNIGLCVDELYSIHSSARAGPGLLGWLTRGRELNQSFLGLTQRPAWISQFLFSESDYICAMTLNMGKDRARLVDMTDMVAFAGVLPLRQWLWYDSHASTLTRYGPVPID